MKKIVMLLVVLMTLSGCATYQAVTTSPLLEASLRIAAGRVLEANPAWVLPAYTFSTLALDTIRTQEITRLGVVDDLFLQMIEDDLTLEEQILAIEIFTSIKDAVIQNLEARGITQPEEQKVYVIQALTWINQSAKLRL